MPKIIKIYEWKYKVTLLIGIVFLIKVKILYFFKHYCYFYINCIVIAQLIIEKEKLIIDII